MSDNIDALRALAAILQLAQGAGSRDADDLPREDYSPSRGFTFVDNLPSIDCDETDREARCVQDMMATIVTKQVLGKTDECEFCLRIIDVSGEDRGQPIVFGVCSDVPTGYSRLPIGHAELPASIGACCCRTDGVVMHKSEKVSQQASILALKDGDVVKIKVKRGSQVSLHKGPFELHGFTVGGDGKFRIGVSMCSKGQRVKIIKEDGDGSVSGLDVLAEFARLLEQAGAAAGQSRDERAVRLPNLSYSQTTGFTWADGQLDAVKCDNRRKIATCVASNSGTLVTEQVLTNSDRCDLVLRFISSAGEGDEAVTFGVVNDVPSGFLQKTVGDRGFPASIGARCGKEQGAVVQEGENKRQLPGIKDGEIVKIEVRLGSQVILTKGSQRLLAFKVGGNGKFRFGLSLSSKGQQVEILDAVRETNITNARPASDLPLLKAGYEVQLPPDSDPRLSSMRQGYNSTMANHCGRMGRVLQAHPRCVRVDVEGTAFMWDIEVFPKEAIRCCHEGCRLFDDCVKAVGHVCDVCRVRLPIGAATRACRTHDYDVCRYCRGLIDVPAVGSKVIQGPSWKWGAQDGEPYTEGVCCDTPDKYGWLTVDWLNGKQNRYRVNEYYQDVWLARENGLLGLQPLDAEDSGKRMLQDLLVGALRTRVKESSQAASLPTERYKSSQGFTFAAPPTSALRLDDSKKELMSVGDYKGSIVTEQVVDASKSPVSFQMQVKSLPLDDKTGHFAWGVCPREARNFQNGFPGKSEFSSSLGACLTSEFQCVLNDDDPKGMIPQVAVGDIVGIKLGNGKIAFMHKGKCVHEVGVMGGHFRFAVCLGNNGQHVEIVANEEAVADGPALVIGANIRTVAVGQGRGQLQYEESTLVGEGGFGRIYKGKLSALPVIVKVLKREAMSEELQESFENEVKVLASFQHPHLVLFIAMNPDMHIIVTEYCELGDLEGFLTKHEQGKRTGANERRRLMLECSQGINFLHDSNVVHRDLKPANVFVAHGPRAKVGDFGLAAPLVVCQEDAKNGAAGTITYMAPEVFIGQISAKSDVYSFSMVLGFAFGMQQLDVSKFTNIEAALLLAHLADTPGLVHQHIIRAIREGKRPALPPSMPVEIQNLVQQCWDEDPEKRPYCMHICEHLEQPLVENGRQAQAQLPQQQNSIDKNAKKLEEQERRQREEEEAKQHRIQQVSQEIDRLQSEKKVAADSDDFRRAQQLKDKIEALQRDLSKISGKSEPQVTIVCEANGVNDTLNQGCCVLQ